ncbi:MAG: glycosyltransferase family 9 protein [Deltaproteobacteria bacterium]|nr:glycosyltransferase family 9 protein [Deltaproteobacteria bacterium]
MTPLRRAAFVVLSELGSAILAYPAMDALLKAHPDAELYFLCFEQNREAVERLGLVEPKRVITVSMESAGAFLSSSMAAVRRMRARNIDTVFDLELFSRFSALLTGASGAARRAGFHRYSMEGLYRGELLTHPVAYNPYQHMSKNFLALVRAVEREPDVPLLKESLDQDLAAPSCAPDPEAVASVSNKLRGLCPAAEGARLLLLNPDPGSLPVRGWPVERFAAAANRLLESHPEAVAALIGLPGAEPYTTALADKLPPSRTADLSGKTSMEELLALLSKSSLLLTADSGPAHLATLTNTPTVVLFGPETPALYAPLHDTATPLFANLACSPCLTAYNHRQTTCKKARCMEAISVDEVVKAAEKYLA